jgi:ligand-binding sensor protein
MTVLDNFLLDFATITGLQATLVDNEGKLLTAPRGEWEFCMGLKQRNLQNRCRESDSIGCCHAASEKKPYIYFCHAGLIDIVVPLVLKTDYTTIQAVWA